MTPLPVTRQARTPSVSTPSGSTQTAANRTPVACQRCKARKVKCGGSPGNDCPVCMKAKVPCSYRRIGKMTMVLKGDVKELETQIKELEARLQDLQSDQSTYETESEAAMPEVEEIRENYNSMFTETETMFVGRSGEHIFVGHAAATSAATFLASNLGDQAHNLSGEFHPQDEGDESTWRRSPSPVLIQLPRQAVARHLYQSQYIYIGTIFSFAQRPHFEARLEHFSKNLPNSKSQQSCLAYCQLLLVYAYGELYSVNQWTSEGPPGLQFFKHALKYLPGAHEPGSVLFVEVLSMVGYYLQVLNRRDAAFLYIGMALRMAISLGLHQELGEGSTVGVVDREHRRRVWWSVYSMDRILTVKSGNPITIHDGDIDVLPPSPLVSLDGEDPSLASVLSSYSKLSQILGKIGEEIYRKKHASGSALLIAIQSIMNELSTWWRKRPAELRINQATMHLDLSREAVSTYLHFYQCVNMTVRPLLFSITQKRLRARASPTGQDWKQGLPKIVVSSVENTITAAQSTAQITSAALNRNLLATYGFMDGEHAFSSALTLVMVNIALDNGQANASAMETALFVLRSMAEKGNRYIEYRLALLQNLSSTIPARDPVLYTEIWATGMGTESAPSPEYAHDSLSKYATPLVGATDHFDMGTDFLQPVEMQEQDMSFEFPMEDDGYVGFPGDQEWIKNMQCLQEEFHPGTTGK